MSFPFLVDTLMIIYENMVQELLQVEMTVETWFKDIQIYQIA